MLSIETCLKYSTSVVEFLNLLVPSQKKIHSVEHVQY